MTRFHETASNVIYAGLLALVMTAGGLIKAVAYAAATVIALPALALFRLTSPRKGRS